MNTCGKCVLLEVTLQKVMEMDHIIINRMTTHHTTRTEWLFLNTQYRTCTTWEIIKYLRKDFPQEKESYKDKWWNSGNTHKKCALIKRIKKFIQNLAGSLLLPL